MDRGHSSCSEMDCVTPAKCVTSLARPLVTTALSCTPIRPLPSNNVCTGTVDWYNLYSSEYDCAYYVSNGWCVDGGFLAGTNEEGGTGWTSGSDFNCPEDNCCACGKGPATTCGATPP